MVWETLNNSEPSHYILNIDNMEIHDFYNIVNINKNRLLNSAEIAIIIYNIANKTQRQA